MKSRQKRLAERIASMGPEAVAKWNDDRERWQLMEKWHMINSLERKPEGPASLLERVWNGNEGE